VGLKPEISSDTLFDSNFAWFSGNDQITDKCPIGEMII